MRTFGQLARAFRKASGRSLYQVAGSCGISQTYLGMIEQGHRNPDLLVRERLKGQLMEVPLGSAWVGLSYWGLSPAYILWDRTLIEDPSAWGQLAHAVCGMGLAPQREDLIGVVTFSTIANEALAPWSPVRFTSGARIGFLEALLPTVPLPQAKIAAHTGTEKPGKETPLHVVVAKYIKDYTKTVAEGEAT